MLEGSNISCGVKELINVHNINELRVGNTPTRFLMTVLKDETLSLNDWDDFSGNYEWDKPYPFIIFSDVYRRDSVGGACLAKFIKDNKLGTVKITRAKRNPNTDNLIVVYVWSPNYKSLIKWHNANKKN